MSTKTKTQTELETKFTERPWLTYKQADSTAMIVATVAKDAYGRQRRLRSQEQIVRVPLNQYRSEADAHLMAASSQLLDFTDSVRQMCASYAVGHVTSTDLADAICDLMIKSGHAAIAKAIGAV